MTVTKSLSQPLCVSANAAHRVVSLAYMYLIQSVVIKHVKFDIQIGSYWPQMASQNVLKLILKSPRFVPFGANLTQFGCQM